MMLNLAYLLLVLFILSVVKQAAGADLGLGYLRQCAFHLVHFYDLDLTESILVSNQYGQPWTMTNGVLPAPGSPHVSTW